MTATEMREAHRGWLRVILTSAVGLVSLATSTWLVVSHITELKIQVRTNTEVAAKFDGRLKVLEDLRIPSAATAATTQTVLGSISTTLTQIERRLYRIETGKRSGFLMTPHSEGKIR